MLSGDHFSDADYADDVAAMEYEPTDIARSLENIEAASSELGQSPEFRRWAVGS